MEYTKGDWKAVLDKGAIYPEWKILGDADIVATIESDENQEANAYLIAAAPNMYKALKQLVNSFETVALMANLSTEKTEQELAPVRKALAKAKGGGEK